jgi:hypothetical protein
MPSNRSNAGMALALKDQPRLNTLNSSNHDREGKAGAEFRAEPGRPALALFRSL